MELLLIKDEYAVEPGLYDCQLAALELIDSLLQYELKEQIIWLSKNDLIESLLTIRLELRQELCFVMLLSSLYEIQNVDLKRTTEGFLMSICSAEVPSFITNNFLKDEVEKMKVEKAIIFLRNHFARLSQILEKNANVVELEVMRAILQDGLFECMTEVCQSVSTHNPTTVKCSCELATLILQIADKLNLEDIFQTFEKNGCLDAFEDLLVHENALVRDSVNELIALYNDLTE